MPLVSRTLWIFVGTAILAYLISDIGFGALADVQVNASPIPDAIREALYNSVNNPLGTVLLFLPFGPLGYISAITSRKKSLFAAGLQFALGILALGGMYLTGHSEAEALMLEHKWTGASLAVGLLPFKGLAVVGVLWGITAFIAKNRQQIANSRH
jgi:hypothetical protein